MIRVIIADDHAVIRTGLTLLLESTGALDVVGEADTGERAVELVAELRPDVVLLDLELGDGINGIETTRRIKRLYSEVNVVILTTYDADADIVRAVDAGAIGYILKTATPEEIRQAVLDGAGGLSALSPPVASRLVQHMQRPDERLTPRESELMQLLAAGHGNRELGRLLSISETTVKTHLGHIYVKLGVSGRSAAIAVARDRGVLRPR